MRDGVFDHGRATAPRNTGAAHVAFGCVNGLGLCDVVLSRLNSPPRTIAVYASRPPSPTTVQHSLPSRRYPLLGRDFHPLDHISFPDALTVTFDAKTYDTAAQHFVRRGATALHAVAALSLALLCVDLCGRAADADQVKPARIVSINMRTDEFPLRLADRDRIAFVTWLSQDGRNATWLRPPTGFLRTMDLPKKSPPIIPISCSRASTRPERRSNS